MTQNAENKMRLQNTKQTSKNTENEAQERENLKNLKTTIYPWISYKGQIQKEMCTYKCQTNQFRFISNIVVIG